MHTEEVNIETLLGIVKRNVERYAQFLKHTPKVLRESMMLSYQTAIDDTLKAMDASKVENPVVHEEKNFVILDENGHAS